MNILAGLAQKGRYQQKRRLVIVGYLSYVVVILVLKWCDFDYLKCFPFYYLIIYSLMILFFKMNLIFGRSLNTDLWNFLLLVNRKSSMSYSNSY